MSFRLGDRIYDDILYFYAESLTGVPLYVLTQLKDAKLNTSAEASEVKDRRGNLVKKVYKSKQGTFEATSCFANTNIIAAASGIDAEYASETNTIIMPRMMTVKAGDTIKLENLVAGSVKVAQIFGDGSMGKVYTLGETASATEFAIASDGTLTVPTDEETSTFFVKYKRNVDAGTLITNTATSFPTSVSAYIKATYYSPCDKSLLLSDYIYLPSFQVSPETEVSFSSESPEMPFKGDLELDYCNGEKILYQIYSADGADSE